MESNMSHDEDSAQAMGDSCGLSPSDNQKLEAIIDQPEHFPEVPLPVEEEKPPTDLFCLPFPALETLWKFLDTTSLLALSKTCTFFSNKIFIYINICSDAERTVGNEKFFACIYEMMSFIPIITISSYLDLKSLLNLRLVCQELKLIVDENLPYMVNGNGNKALDYSVDSGGSSSNHRFPLEMVTSKTKTSIRETTIMDIETDDLKRIFTYVLGKNDFSSLNTSQSYIQEINLSRTCLTFSRIISELYMYAFVEYDESDDLDIMDLPIEVHKQLLRTCNKESLPILRKVCKLFQFEIDSFVGVDIHMSDTKYLQTISPFRFPPASGLIVNRLLFVKPLNLLFNQHSPQLITRLVLKGLVATEVMVRILDECICLKSINVKETLKMPGLRHELSNSIPLNKLQSLELKTVDEDDDEVFEEGWHWNIAFDFLSQDFIMPKITKFTFLDKNLCTHMMIFQTANSVLCFLERHVDTLKDIELILLGNCVRTCPCPQFKPLVNISKLLKLKLRMFSYDCNWKICRPFSQILMAQKSLEDMEIFKLSDWEFHEEVIKKNCLTLKSITIQKNLVPVIDLSVLENCVNLETLRICRNDDVNRLPDPVQVQLPGIVQSTDFDPRLRNLNKLPKSLKHLHILDQTVRSIEIEEISLKLQNLETLELQFLGGWRCERMGVTLKIFKNFLQLRKLQNLFIEELMDLLDGKRYLETLDKDVRKFNLIPKEYVDFEFQWRFNFRRSFLFGTLISEKEPSRTFMPQWVSRYLKYFVEIFKGAPLR